ncbi:zinc ribbon domain-containing protein [Arthrobacter sp. H20]|uniref:FmdB family zinc ribbon protein n=1 Tax=Arthrobacter sp. H20 TaxID=1267981 RepID=UPI00047D092A|nr:zinc ribbon domain-containing protein [Arthrobacter sp. H20]
MPIYEYRCPECSIFEAIFPMGAASDLQPCPTCGQTSRRKMSAPNLSKTGSAAFKLIDSAHRSASEPQVLTGALPPGSHRKVQAYTSNPLHSKLPRP